MRSIEIILERMERYGERKAMYWNGKVFTYNQLVDFIAEWGNKLDKLEMPMGSTCGILSDYSPRTCALFFALIKRNMILVPFTMQAFAELQTLKGIAGVEYMFNFDENDNCELEKCLKPEINNLVIEYRTKMTPGLIVFSSGSTGRPKGILQNCENVMDKFIEERKSWQTILFLMMDHFGGFNTLLSTFSNGGMGICLPNRTPETVCKIIQDSGANLLPTTPTFLNLLFASGCWKVYDISSIKLVTYGTEMANETVLKKTKTIFPNAKLKQTYGLSELGVLRSKSEGDETTWMKIGGNEFNLKIVDNILWIKANSNMVGYLNAPNPFDKDGWFCTGDVVEVKGDYMRFKGRKTEVINVGGQKVYPAEVEAFILQVENVAEVTVYGMPHPLMGQVVACKITLVEAEDKDVVINKIRKMCSQSIAKYKMPVKYDIISKGDQHNARFKKVRR